MNLIKRYKNLPVTTDELTEWVIVHREVHKAREAELRAINKVDPTSVAKDAVLLKAQDHAGLLLFAEARLGKLLAAIPKQGKKKEYGSTGGTIPSLPENITKKESHFLQTIDKNPEVVERVQVKAKEEGRLPTSQEVVKEIKKERQAARQQEIIDTPTPTGKYHTIIIDPPWKMEKIMRDVRPNQDEFAYKTMAFDEIKDYPIPADDNCFLFMWTTQKHLPSSFDILDTWGFKYVLTFVWHKAGGFQPFGLPQYNCEFVVFGKRGEIKFLDTKDFFVCFSGKRREHSRKPEEFYQTINRVCPGPRANIFTRENVDGFYNFGNEKDKF